MPQVWIAIFFILLAVTELYQSIKKIDLPFPAYLVLGTLLAVASNYQHKALFGQVQEAILPEVDIAAPVLNSVQLPVLPTTVNHDPEVYGSANKDRA
jgi:hypothetical protein